MRRGLAATAAVLALAGCGGGGSVTAPAPDAPTNTDDVDYQAWEADLERALGHRVPDFDTVAEVIVLDICPQDDIATFTAMNADQGTEDLLRLHISHACPERLPEINAVLRGR